MATACREIMTKEIVSCVPEDTVEHAATLMKTQDIGPVPVVESHVSRKLLGIVTDRDLVMKVIAEGRNPKTTTLRDVMTPNPVTCKEDDDVSRAMDLVSEHKVRRRGQQRESHRWDHRPGRHSNSCEQV